MSPGVFGAAARQARVVDDVAHRPWPLPEEPWTSAQSWTELAFLHRRVDIEDLARLVPRSVELETFDGSGWLGVVPFVLTGLRPRGLPALPRLTTFPELNVRTYVSLDGRPGVWFFSLDAASRLFVEAGKRLYRLPYHHARMRCERAGDEVRYESTRPGAAFRAHYHGEGPLFRPGPGSLEEFLTERYCLYTEDGGRLYRAEIHHPPWSLRRGAADVELDTMAPLPLPDGDPEVLVAERQDVVVWPLERI